AGRVPRPAANAARIPLLHLFSRLGALRRALVVILCSHRRGRRGNRVGGRKYTVTMRNQGCRPIRAGVAGRGMKQMIAVLRGLSAATAMQAGAQVQRGTMMADATPALMTAKERLSDKASDNQRVNDCNVPPEKRGPVKRPTECTQK